MEEATIRGNINQSLALGKQGLYYGTVDEETTKNLIMRAAKASDSEAMNILMSLYRQNRVSKNERENTLRAKQHAFDEVKCDDREFAKRLYDFCVKAGASW
jgi:phosphopantetheine adenylyltransferase